MFESPYHVLGVAFNDLQLQVHNKPYKAFKSKRDTIYLDNVLSTAEALNLNPITILDYLFSNFSYANRKRKHLPFMPVSYLTLEHCCAVPANIKRYQRYHASLPIPLSSLTLKATWVYFGTYKHKVNLEDEYHQVINHYQTTPYLNPQDEELHQLLLRKFKPLYGYALQEHLISLNPLFFFTVKECKEFLKYFLLLSPQQQSLMYNGFSQDTLLPDNFLTMAKKLIESDGSL